MEKERANRTDLLREKNWQYPSIPSSSHSPLPKMDDLSIVIYSPVRFEVSSCFFFSASLFFFVLCQKRKHSIKKVYVWRHSNLGYISCNKFKGGWSVMLYCVFLSFQCKLRFLGWLVFKFFFGFDKGIIYTQVPCLLSYWSKLILHTVSKDHTCGEELKNLIDIEIQLRHFIINKKEKREKLNS